MRILLNQFKYCIKYEKELLVNGGRGGVNKTIYCHLQFPKLKKYAKVVFEATVILIF